MQLRKDVNVFVFEPRRRFFNIVVELKNVPGALNSVLQILQDMRINILGSFSSVETRGKAGTWSAFVEGSGHKAAELKGRIESSPYVLDSIVKTSKKGFLVDSVHFPLSLNTGDRAVMMRSEYVRKMLSSIRKEFGSGGKVILYEEGRAYGKGAGANYSERLGVRFTRSNLKEVLNLYQALGWFKLESVKQTRKTGALTIRAGMNFECEGAKSREPYSHFVRGHLSGTLTAMMGKDMICEETECIAAGSKSCEFRLKPAAKGA